MNCTPLLSSRVFPTRYFPARVLVAGFLVGWLTGCLSLGHAHAADHMADPATDFKDLCKRVVAGDTIVLADGDWKDTKLTFDRLVGTADSPITIRAATSGKVVFSGQSQLRFSGQHLIVDGLVFQNTQTSDVLESRSHSQRHAHHCRVTNCVFDQSPDAEKGMESRWLSLYGTNNRVDHCRFVGKRSRGTTLVVWVDDTPNHHRIDHNFFGHRPELGRNGGETIRIGTSEVAHLDSQTIVTDNYFDRCNGESEIVSNKSCGNVYRYNVFHQCSGALTLRHGHRCTVDANVFWGDKQSGTGGVRIIGSSHRVTNNYFAHLRGDEMRAAISMMNAPTNPKANEYSQVRHALVAHNTFIDCKVTMELGVEASKKLTAAPVDCRIESNLIASGKWQPFRIHAQLDGFQWTNNFATKGDRENDANIPLPQVQIDWHQNDAVFKRPVATDQLQVVRSSDCLTDIDGGQRSPATQVGCDDPATQPRTWVTPTTTGPQENN